MAYLSLAQTQARLERGDTLRMEFAQRRAPLVV